MNMRTAMPLVLAVAVGGVTVKYGHAYLQRQAQRGAATVEGHGDVQSVLVVAGDLPIGHALENRDLQPVDVPSALVPAQSIAAVPNAAGRVLAVAMTRGQMLTETMLAPVGTSQGLQAAVPKGKRAFTVDVNEVSGLSGMLAPGSRVDVVATVTDNQSQESHTWTILQNAPVTAVGARLTGDAPADDKDPLNRTQVKTVTLLVTPDQAETLDLAYTRCKPRLVLRNQSESDDSTGNGITFTELFRGPESKASQFGEALAGLLIRMAAAKQPAAAAVQPAAPTTAPTVAAAIVIAPTPAPAPVTPKRAVELVRGGVSTFVYFEKSEDGSASPAMPGAVAAKKSDPFESPVQN